MNELTIEVLSGRRRSGFRSRRRRHRHREEDGFLCRHCRAYVSTVPFLSRVQNRNHCPYCLWSRHLDLIEPGDRLAACKALMQPIGLTVKVACKKYGPGRGELMLIHLCLECGKVSINRIAADDDPHAILAVFEDSFHLESMSRGRLAADGIWILSAEDGAMVEAQLFGFEPGLVG